MKSCRATHLILTNSRGVTLVLVAVLMAALIGIAALAIDIGYIATTKNELQNIADAAALAATGKLGDIYITNGSYNHDTDKGDIQTVAIDVGDKNRAAGLAISVALSDIEIGSWDGDPDVSPRFTANTVNPDAVRVTVRRDAVLNGAISTFFARVFGVDSIDVAADAVAALTTPIDFDEGTIKLPVGLSEHQFPDNCKNPITFGDTHESCAGWHIFDEDKVNANDLDAMILGLIINDDRVDPDGIVLYGEDWLLDAYPDIKKVPPGYISPGVPEDATHFNFQGGTIASLFNSDVNNPAPLQVLFDYWKERDDDVVGDAAQDVEDVIGPFDNDDVWLTTVPVYADSLPCENPTGEIKILGQADIVVTAINSPPDNSISAVITCGYKQFRGGGGSGGTTGTIPNLVE